MRTAIVTVVHGRHDHWRMQRAALARTDTRFEEHLVVAIDDQPFQRIVDTETAGATGTPPRVIHLDTHGEGLPLATARNTGARVALSRGAELLVFLDVDCLPAPELVRGYCEAAAAPATRGALLCGPVTYLDPPEPAGYDLARLSDYDAPHPARPAPQRGETLLGGSHELFWSLSFAVDAPTWTRVGGFCEDYLGYGGEDTDFGQRARASGVPLAWVGDARAYHQHHPTTDPPVQHLDAILRNAAVFYARWGWWPMQGWLQQFERSGLIERDHEGSYRRAAVA